MKITVLKSALMENLTPAMGTVSNKNTITSIEGVLIETLSNGKIQISTYDMNKGVRATFDPVSIEREGKYIINAQRFYQTVRVLPEGEVTIEVNDRLNCNISAGKISFSIFAMNGQDFPNLPELYSDKGFTISSSIIKKMIGKVSHSIAEQDNRPMLCGAFFNIKNDEIEVVSCDSFTLSKCNYKCEVGKINSAPSVECSFIMPGHALSELSKILGDSDDEVTFYLSRKHAIIKNGETIFFTRTIDSEYIDYNKIMPKENDIFVTVERERFLDGLERANIIAEEKIQGSGRSYVKIITDGQYISLSSTSVNGNVCDEMDCIHDGEDIEIGFNCRYLINSVRASEGDNIRITMKTPTQAITIEPAEADEKYSYYYMILPVRMNEQK